jgi:hypothetical protein
MISSFFVEHDLRAQLSGLEARHRHPRLREELTQRPGAAIAEPVVVLARTLLAGSLMLTVSLPARVHFATS